MADVWRTIGSVRKNDKGGFYAKITEDVTLAKDSVLQLQDPRKKLTESVTAGRLSEEKAAEIAAKIPDFIKYNIVLPPPKK